MELFAIYIMLGAVVIATIDFEKMTSPSKGYIDDLTANIFILLFWMPLAIFLNNKA